MILHCFSEPELLDVALERRYYVSFAGNVTYPKATELRDAARRLSADRILAETDSPFLAPQGGEAGRTSRRFVVDTMEVLAAARSVPLEELAAAVDENANRVFAIA